MSLEANPNGIVGIGVRKELSGQVGHTENYKCILWSPLMHWLSQRSTNYSLGHTGHLPIFIGPTS